MDHAIGDKVSFYAPQNWPVQGEFGGKVIGSCQVEGKEHYLIRVSSFRLHDALADFYPWPMAVEPSHVYLG